MVMEGPGGDLVGVEVKASNNLTGRDFKGLRKLQEVAGERFHRGVVLYAGSEHLPFGDRLEAVPLGALWRAG